MAELPPELLRTLTRVANAFRASGVQFALTGGCAVYALGGPASAHDVDVLLVRQDVDAALEALRRRGLSIVDTDEDWLAKAYDGDWLVDLLFRPNERTVTPELLARAKEIQVGAVRAPVMPATDLVVDKLLTLGAHRCDFADLLPVVRALREQVDWTRVWRDTAFSPYAESFLLLVDRLGIASSWSADD